MEQQRGRAGGARQKDERKGHQGLASSEGVLQSIAALSISEYFSVVCQFSLSVSSLDEVVSGSIILVVFWGRIVVRNSEVLTVLGRRVQNGL